MFDKKQEYQLLIIRGQIISMDEYIVRFYLEKYTFLLINISFFNEEIESIAIDKNIINEMRYKKLYKPVLIIYI